MIKLVGLLVAALAASACATIDEARYPLGARENPVKSEMPSGERAYLERLRCASGKAPTYSRVGSFGEGPYGNIIDGYSVKCEGSEPADTVVFMDMYFRGFVEARAVPGFTIVSP